MTIALKNPGKYKSVSAFAPITNPSNCPWGNKAFEGYLNGKDEWASHDALELVKNWTLNDKQEFRVYVGNFNITFVVKYFRSG